MKLKAIHCYQYVRFQSKNENFLQKGPNMPDLELELIAIGSTAVVRATTSKDSILVFPTNIAYAVDMKSKAGDQRGNLLDNQPAAPRKKA